MMQRRKRTTPSERAAESLLRRASHAEVSGHLREAERLCVCVLREFPADAEARFIQARVWAQTGRLVEAIAAFRDLLAQDTGFDAARLSLIGALFLTNACGEGLNHLQWLARQCAAEEVDSIDIAESDTTQRQHELEAVLAPLWQSYTDRT